MKDKNKIYLDNVSFQNPDLSAKANKAYKIIIPIAGLFFIIAGILNLISNRIQILNIFQVIAGSIFLVISIFQPIFYNQFGRRYIAFGTNNLEIKNNYFKHLYKIAWGEIAKVKFHYSKFIIYQQSNQSVNSSSKCNG